MHKPSPVLWYMLSQQTTQFIMMSFGFQNLLQVLFSMLASSGILQERTMRCVYSMAHVLIDIIEGEELWPTLQPTTKGAYSQWSGENMVSNCRLPFLQITRLNSGSFNGRSSFWGGDTLLIAIQCHMTYGYIFHFGVDTRVNVSGCISVVFPPCCGLNPSRPSALFRFI